MPIKKVPIIDIGPKQWKKDIPSKRKSTYLITRNVRVKGFYTQIIEAYSEEEALAIAQRNPFKNHNEIHYDDCKKSDVLDANINDVEELD